MTRQPYDHELRLERASEHLEKLNAELEGWSERDAYRLVYEADRNRGEYIVRARFLRTPSPRLGLIIGDCLHNLRSALDNLIYDLSVAYTGFPLPLAIEERTEFPIFGPKPLPPSRRKKMIGGVHPRAQVVIDSLQPHVRGNSYISHALWMLYELSNIDKHRLIHLPMVAQDTVFIEVPPSAHEDLDPVITDISVMPGSPVEDGAEVARFSTKSFKPGQEMNVKVHLVLQVAFPQGSVARGRPVVYTLRWIQTYIISQVLPPLRPYLP